MKSMGKLIPVVFALIGGLSLTTSAKVETPPPEKPNPPYVNPLNDGEKSPQVDSRVRGPAAGEFPNPDSPDGFAGRTPDLPYPPSTQTPEPNPTNQAPTTKPAR